MQQIGRYRIVNELGRGAMGVVYRALDPAIGRTVAIKTFRLSELSAPNEREKIHGRLFREAHSAGILSHPGIVTIYDISEEGDIAYIAMEYVNGSTLEKLMVADPPPTREAILRILTEAATALDYAHAKGIVHRDIKPANIMISESGSVKITDFGVAKILSQQLTMADTILGTPNYMSPEQIEAKKLDGRSDQFALSVISYELLTGEKPFVADSLPTLIFKIVREEPMSPQHLNPTVGGAVGNVIRKGLSKSPDNRFPTCADFVAGLSEALRSQPGWTPQRRGAVLSMATVAATVPSPEPAPSPPPLAAEPEPPRPPVAAAPPSPAPEVAEATPLPKAEPIAPIPPLPEAPKLGVRHEPVEPSSTPLSTLRYPLLALGVLVAAGAGFFAWQRVFSTPDAGTSAGQVSQPPAAPTPAPTPAPVAEAPASEPVKTPEPTPAAPKPGVTPAVAKPAPAPKEATVEVTTTPPGANIVFDRDSDRTCTSPCSISLDIGRHVYSATLAGYRTATRIMEVPKESRQSVTLEQQSGTVMVSTTPAGATILINGRPHAQKTPTMLTLPAGKHKIELSLAGHPNYEEVVEVRDAVSRHMSVDFTGR